MEEYICKTCGATVVICDDGSRVWSCEHEGGTIVAPIEAVVSSNGGIST